MRHEHVVYYIIILSIKYLGNNNFRVKLKYYRLKLPII